MSKRQIKLSIFLISLIGSLVLYLYLTNNTDSQTSKDIFAQTTINNWPMAGANPQRTSWVSEQLPKESLVPHWAVPFEPYLIPKTQPIAADGKVMVGTGKGVWALDAETGQTVWAFTTEMPLGQSPSVDVTNQVVYAPGLDHQLYALDLQTGSKLWSFTGRKGFYSNPLIINDSHTNNQPLVILGNRDGHLYAIWGQGSVKPGQLKWELDLGSPILHSQAYLDGVIYTGAQDTKAHAINLNNGTQKWISDKLPTAGFHSWWPVVWQESDGDQHVIFTTTSLSHMNMGGISENTINEYTWNQIWKDYASTTPTSAAGLFGYHHDSNTNWALNTPTLDFSKVNDNNDSTPPVQIFRQSPELRTIFVLDAETGTERQYSMDGQGNHFAPILLNGNNGGSYPPPMVSGANNVAYFWSTAAAKGTWFAYSPILGWQEGTPFFSLNTIKFSWGNGAFPGDEPVGLSGGGDITYFSMIDDRMVGGFDVTQPVIDPFPEIFTNKTFANNRQWRFDNPSSNWKITGYNQQEIQYQTQLDTDDPGGTNGLYYNHSESPGPSVYNQRIFLNRSNAIIALGPASLAQPNQPHLLPPVASPQNIQEPTPNHYTLEGLRLELESEISQIISSGHLASLIWPIGIQNQNPLTGMGGLSTIYATPYELFSILTKALPYLDVSLQSQLKNYLIQEHANYPIYKTARYGMEGAQRQWFDYPSDASLLNTVSSICCHYFPPDKGWTIPPQNMYALYVYARDVLEINQADAQALLNEALSNTTFAQHFDPSFNRYPSLTKDSEHPHIYNGYIAGLYGYKGLLELSGKGSGNSDWEQINNQLNNLLSERVNSFHWDLNSPDKNHYYYYNLAAWNFINMVPELAEYMKTNVDNADPINGLDAVINDYSNREHLWYVSLHEESQGEGAFAHPSHYHSLFQAKALLQDASYQELQKYLDISAFKVGDLYYIDNLIATLEALSSGETATPTPTAQPTITGDINNDGVVNILDYTLLSNAFGTSDSAADLNSDGIVNILDYTILSNNFGNTV